jgi:DNA-binding response OmpR family regulator
VESVYQEVAVSKRILIIEDDPDTRDFLVQAFSDSGFSVSVASSESALLQFGLVQPNLIVFDIHTSGEGSWRTLQRIRELSAVPIITLCAPDDVGVRVQSLDQGADLCLAKPVGVRELQARVRALLRRDQRAYRPNWQMQTVPT